MRHVFRRPGFEPGSTHFARRHIRRIAGTACVTLLLAPAAGLAAQTANPVPDYGKASSWLCLPGRSDSCSTPLATTELLPSGYGRTSESRPAKDPPVDCFYVYPTVSSDSGLNSDMVPGREEQLMAETQLARFASVCRTYAPVYRQMTVASVAAFATGADVTGPARLAYGDVARAWRTYLATYNRGRPFVLIGHSQGSLMLQQLIAREIEGRPDLAARMMLAIIPGYNLLVPQGRTVGGTFKRTPLCSSFGQIHCVVSWVSFREKNAPPPGAMFGYADAPGMTVGCVNPGSFGARGWVPLESVWFTRSTLPVPGGAIEWSSEGAPATPYVRTQGLVSGRCVNDGARGYLSVRTNADPGDKRTDRIGGEVGLFGMFLPGWGMHLADVAIAQGNLVRAVGQIDAKDHMNGR